ncbi:MAG: molybdopterin converting factor subunit 1 [Gammaproteobacteria bacterium]|nr:molybdopterin converting factor subunit 1 [Gammaproteobacteria bacterium]
MSIQVKFFASLRERMDRAGDEVAAEAGLTASDVWAAVADGVPLPANVLVAVNQEYVNPDHAVDDGDEVAFFPPVTGG